ncbi:enolase C-terminal domain-like protein [Achromobacter xylosoxidans]|uniref:enolase C-terminal domain-like protein n=1 Tax=Alcaligenes xylosoxydans xylosoxydans TaxID=85698 RepID=UPI0006C84987|nr:enolase C-terminal domain-like protein [Achromobacter xylosoxidans]
MFSRRLRSFHQNGTYSLRRDRLSLSSGELVHYWKTWACSYPILSLEDPFDEDDWEGFRSITEQLGEQMQIVGDDLFVTNWKFVERGIQLGCCNCVLIKPNQIGTLTEAMDTARLAMKAGFACMVSHRSGETEDTSISDLAVALGCGQIKAGAPARGERVAKYNRLLAIERLLNGRASYPGRDAFRRPIRDMKPPTRD